MASIENLDGELIVFTEGDAAKPIDSDGDATVTGSGFGGGRLTISITANKDASEDVLGVDWTAPGVLFEEGFVEGAAVYVDEVLVAFVAFEAGAPGEPVVLDLTEQATGDAIARIIGAITYTNVDQNEPSALRRTLTVHLADGEGQETSANVYIDVVPVLDINDPPIVDMDAASAGIAAVASYTEGAAPLVLVPRATVTDSDTSIINGGSLIVTVQGTTAFDHLEIQDQGFGSGKIKIENPWEVVNGHDLPGALSEGGSVFATYRGGTNGTPLEITFLPEQSVGTAYINHIQWLYRAITYRNSSEQPATQRTIEFKLDDGDGTVNGGNPITTTTVDVNIARVNDAPVVDLNGATDGDTVTLAYTERGAATRIAPAATVADDNPAVFNGGTLTISFADGGTAGDQLTIGLGGAENVGIEGGIGGGGGSDSGAISLNGSILATFKGGKDGAPLVVTFFPVGSVAGFTTAEYVQAFLRSISYNNTSDAPPASRTINFTLKDGQGTANGGVDTTIATATVEITSTPDSPVAANDTLSLVLANATQYNVSQLLANDRDPDGDSFTLTSVSNRAGGTVSLSNGIITFTPTSATGAASFNYTITDSTGRTATAVATINRAPVAITDSFGALLNSPVTYTPYNLLGNDTDYEANVRTITSVSNAVRGTVVLNADGSVTFTPEEGYVGAASFKYTISDGLGFSTGNVNVNVRASNANPVANNDTRPVNEDTNLDISNAQIIANDADSDGGARVIQSVGNATGGTAVLRSDGSVRFTPTLNFNGTAGFDYVLSDSQGGTATARVTVTVNPVNDVPIAGVNTLAGLEDTPLVIGWDTVLANDMDVDGDVLTITGVNNATNGSVSLNAAARTITFTPGVNYGADRSGNFRYTISDGKGGTHSAQVNVNLTSVNDAPTGIDGKVALLQTGDYVFTEGDFATGFADTADIGTFGLGANAFAGIRISSLPTSGTLYYDADGAGGADAVAVTAGQLISKADLAAGKLRYVADPTAITNPTFGFQVRDDGGTANGGVDTDTTPSVMEIAITALNDAPLLDLNGTGAGTEAQAMFNLGSGGVGIAPNATLVDDNPSFGGGYLQVSVGGLTFGDSVFVSEDAAGLIVLGTQIYRGDVLVARSSASGSSLRVDFYAPADAATVQSIIRAVQFSTNGDSADPRTIEFNLVDGGGNESGGQDSTALTATVSINTPPTAGPVYSFTGTEDVALVIDAATLLSGVVDPDGDSFSIGAVHGGNNGTPALSADGQTVTFTPNANAFGAASFSYDIVDSKGGKTTVTVNGTLAPTTDDPIARTDSLLAPQDAESSFSASKLIENDSDPDFTTPLVVTGVTSVTGGTVTLENGIVRFVPTAGLLGPASFTYTVADGNGGIATGTVNVAVQKLVAAAEDVSATYTLADLVGAADGEGRPYTLVGVEPVSGGSVGLDMDGGVSFLSNLNFTGRAGFNVIYSNGIDQFTSGILVDVAAMPDNPLVAPVTLLAPKGESYTFAASQILGTSSDPDGTPVQLSTVISGSNGSAVLNQDGTVTFSPNTGFEGSASFQFTVTDGNGGSTTANANVMVLRTLAGTEDSDAIFTVTQIAGATPSSFTLGFDFVGGLFFRSGNNIFFTPDENFSGLASVDYMATIGGIPTEGRVLIKVAPVNDAPLGQNVAVTVAEDSVLTLGLQHFPFTDLEGHSLAGVVITNIPVAGKLWFDADGPGGDAATKVTPGRFVSREDIIAGKLTFTPDADYSGGDLLAFRVRDSGGTANNGVDTDTASNEVTITVTSVDDAAVGVADTGSTAESATTILSVLANDTDIDGGQAPAITRIAGLAATVGVAVTLASGALATLNADGTISYDPNGAFNALVSQETADATGAVNTSAVDSFTYELAGGSIGTVSVTITGESSAGDALGGAAGDDDLGGTTDGDFFRLDQGGADDVDGGEGDDGFFFGGTFDAADAVDGGDGDKDQLGLRGSYSATITGTMLSNIETLGLLSGSDTRFGGDGSDSFAYSLTVQDGVVGEGAKLTVNANALQAGESFTFDGRLETDGVLTFFGGLGAENLTGGQGDDGFFYGVGRFDAATDRVDGFSGDDDQFALRGDYSDLVDFGSLTVRNIDTVAVLSASDTRFGGGASGFSYNLRIHDDNLGAGELMTVNGAGLTAIETLTFDGSHETDGSFRFIGGAGADRFTGGDQTDVIYGGGGADVLYGGLGDDVFAYRLSDSDSAAPDHIGDFDADDWLDLTEIDIVAGGTREGFHFAAENAFTGQAGEAILIQSGNDWALQADVDGNGAADFTVLITGAEGYVPLTSDVLL
jgi:hypothetical protein